MFTFSASVREQIHQNNREGGLINVNPIIVFVMVCSRLPTAYQKLFHNSKIVRTWKVFHCLTMPTTCFWVISFFNSNFPSKNKQNLVGILMKIPHRHEMHVLFNKHSQCQAFFCYAFYLHKFKTDFKFLQHSSQTLLAIICHVRKGLV